MTDPFGLNECEIDKPDWSRTRHDGYTTQQHVELHNVDDLTKPKHGVFSDDGFTQTNDAWTNKEPPVTQPNGNDKYVISSPEAGLEGGFRGSGDVLNNVTIITEGGTNKIVTAFPSK